MAFRSFLVSRPIGGPLRWKLSPAARRFLTDAITITVLTSVGAGLVEWLLLGLPSERVLWLRGVSAAINLATGGFYGWWRDRVLASYLGSHPVDRLHTGIGEWMAFSSFQAPLYVLTLLVFGASGTQALLGLLCCLLAASAAAPLTGFFLDAIRRATERTPALFRRLRPVPKPKEPPAHRAA